MKNVMKRCLALIILFEKHIVGIDANYIKDNIPQYRELSPSAFHRSFERDKEVLRSMGFVINYSNDNDSTQDDNENDNDNNMYSNDNYNDNIMIMILIMIMIMIILVNQTIMILQSSKQKFVLSPVDCHSKIE